MDGGDVLSTQTTDGVQVKSSDEIEIPDCYRFKPFDHELFIHYLQNKLLDRPLPYNKINDVNLYDHTPYDLAENYKPWEEKQWYFFTHRNRKYRNGKRPRRDGGDGYWKATGGDREKWTDL
ncbi:NAC domain-containing protein 68-like [Tasmannia lanceolata]|uniref:NAC domain-containing protein 68-like n=1 Tax=Tasmannia lanceolata TaxID=3420 RepID=UPI004064239F